jgi:beta-1,4-mannosyltransferase
MHPFSTSFTQVPTSTGRTAEPAAPPSANIASSRPSSFPEVAYRVNSPPLGLPSKRTDRPALVVSSTSWTPDEDFSILLAALASYEQRAQIVNERAPGTLPKVLCVVTGKGPLKERYMNEIKRMQEGRGEKDGWEWVRCVSLWLEPEDYPVLLGEFGPTDVRTITQNEQVPRIWAFACIRALLHSICP